MRNTTSRFLDRLAQQMAAADMKEIASVLGVSLATAYRYRKSPSEMSLAAFERLVAYLRVPVSINLVYRESDVVAAEEMRLSMEREIADAASWRFVSTLHFTVNCETDEFTRELLDIQYGSHLSDIETSQYLKARSDRRSVYLSGAYRSEEVIYGPSYIDFFYGRGVFGNIRKATRETQLHEVISTSALPHVSRRIYADATPELPVILNYGIGKSIIRVEDLTICFTDEDSEEAVRVLRGYADSALYRDESRVRAFFENPLNPA